MDLIASNEALAAFCGRLRGAPFITVDTEFMRESTFWPKLCLLQVAGPDEATCIDPLAPGLDLAPLLDLMRDQAILKVFHAARQDLEIFHKLMGGELPAPLFDTQIGAMVCGFGDQASYESLVTRLANAGVDKSSRFADWSKRPLTPKQLAYALADVTHLRIVFTKLKKRIERDGRDAWIADELANLTDPRTYAAEPDDAWLRLRPRSSNPRFLATLKAATAWREREAQTRDIPRQRILRDEALLELAGDPPRTIEDLLRFRGFSRGLAEGSAGERLLTAVRTALEQPEDAMPRVAREAQLPRGMGPLTELLKVLLKLKCDEHDVAQKLVANSADLDQIAADDNADVAALKGWRRDLFGADALALKHGRLALAADGFRIRLIRLDAPVPAAATA